MHFISKYKLYIVGWLMFSAVIIAGATTGYGPAHRSLFPEGDGVCSLGSSSAYWKELFVEDVYIKDGKTLQLPVMSFVVENTTKSLVSASTQPGLEIDNSIPSMVWADGEDTPISITFRVPQDYNSGGAFRVLADESDSTTPNQIDFAVYVNPNPATASANWDASATNQTPVALTKDAGCTEMVTLTPGTDFDALVKGDIVTFRMWRDDVATGTGDLEVYYVEFYYE